MLKVLLVEDNPGQSQIYSESLDKSGFKVISVYDGSEIEEVIDKEDIDIIVSDTDMPMVNGNIACERLLKLGKVKDKLIVGMSSRFDFKSYWFGIAHNFISKKHIHDLGEIIQRMYDKFKSSPNPKRYGNF
ncbi:response regulator [Candidatus Woesearchaeota archaeon]|nr:response regulator [Candidatus Woesearchaeota archaeon]